MNIQIILTVTALLTLVLAAGAPTIASAQYVGNMNVDEKIGANTLEEVLKIKSEQVKSTWPTADHPWPSPPSPDDYRNHVLVFMGTILLGGIAAIFLIRGRSGRYAAVGRG